MRRVLAALALVGLFAAPSHGDICYKKCGSLGGGSGGGGLGGGSTFVEADDPVDGSDPCNTGDIWFNATSGHSFFCEDGATDDWTQITDA